MGPDMRQLTEAVERAQTVTSGMEPERQRRHIVEAVLMALHDITMDRSELDLHEAQVHRYTTIAVHRIIQGS